MPRTAPRALEDGARFAPLSVDVDGDVAAVLFLTRRLGNGSDGSPVISAWTFHRRAEEWTLLSGGWHPVRVYPLGGRPSRSALGGNYVRPRGLRRTLLNAHRRLPWGATYASTAWLEVSAEVDQIRVRDRRIRVPFHGQVVVVWSSRRQPSAMALDAHGRRLTRVALRSSVPTRFRIRAWWYARFRPPATHQDQADGPRGRSGRSAGFALSQCC